MSLIVGGGSIVKGSGKKVKTDKRGLEFFSKNQEKECKFILTPKILNRRG